MPVTLRHNANAKFAQRYVHDDVEPFICPFSRLANFPGRVAEKQTPWKSDLGLGNGAFCQLSAKPSRKACWTRRSLDVEILDHLQAWGE